MSFVELLFWARRGLDQDESELREMLRNGLEGRSKFVFDAFQARLEKVSFKKHLIADLEKIFDVVSDVLPF